MHGESFCWLALFSFQRLLHFLNLNSISIHKQEHGGKNEIKMLWYIKYEAMKQYDQQILY